MSIVENNISQGKALLAWNMSDARTPIPEAVKRAFGVFPREFGAFLPQSGNQTLANWICSYYIQQLFAAMTTSPNPEDTITVFVERFDLLGLIVKFHNHQHLTQGSEVILIQALLTCRAKDVLHWQRYFHDLHINAVWKAAVLRDGEMTRQAATHALVESRHLIDPPAEVFPGADDEEPTSDELQTEEKSKKKGTSILEIATQMVLNPEGIYRFALMPLDYESETGMIDLGLLSIEAVEEINEDDEEDEGRNEDADTDDAAEISKRVDKKKKEKKQKKHGTVDEEEKEEEEMEEDEELSEDEDDDFKPKRVRGRACFTGQRDGHLSVPVGGRTANTGLTLHFKDFTKLSARIKQAIDIFLQFLSENDDEGTVYNEAGVSFLLNANTFGYAGSVVIVTQNEVTKTLGTVCMWKVDSSFNEEGWMQLRTILDGCEPEILEIADSSGSYNSGIIVSANLGVSASIMYLTQWFGSLYGYVTMSSDAEGLPQIITSAENASEDITRFLTQHPLEPKEFWELRKTMFAGTITIHQNLITNDRYISNIPDDLAPIRRAIIHGISRSTLEDLKTLGYFDSFEQPDVVSSSPNAIQTLINLFQTDPYTLFVARYVNLPKRFSENREAYLAACTRHLCIQLLCDEDDAFVPESTYARRSYALYQLTGPTALHPGTRIAHIYHKWTRRFLSPTPQAGSHIPPIILEDILLFLGTIMAQNTGDQEEDGEDDDVPPLEEVEQSVESEPNAQLFVSALRNNAAKSEKSSSSLSTGVLIGASVALVAAVAAGAFFLGRMLPNNKKK